MPKPPAAFSPLITTRSSFQSAIKPGSRSATTLRPLRPTMSPMKRMRMHYFGSFRYFENTTSVSFIILNSFPVASLLVTQFFEIFVTQFPAKFPFQTLFFKKRIHQFSEVRIHVIIKQEFSFIRCHSEL